MAVVSFETTARSKSFTRPNPERSWVRNGRYAILMTVSVDVIRAPPLMPSPGSHPKGVCPLQGTTIKKRDKNNSANQCGSYKTFLKQTVTVDQVHVAHPASAKT